VKIKFLLLACTALVLQGCETYYQAPTSGDTAKIRFAASAASQIVMVKAYETERCEFGKTGGIMGLIGFDIGGAGNTLGMMGYSEASGLKPLERVITAGKPFTFSLSRMRKINDSLEQCKLSFSFLPAVGREYEVEFGEDVDRCYISAFQLQSGRSGSAEKILEPSVQETEQLCNK
jgi:hypothetical protein